MESHKMKSITQRILSEMAAFYAIDLEMDIPRRSRIISL